MILKNELRCYRGGWYRYLLGEKFTNDSNFLVCEIGRGRGVEKRSLEMTEVLQGGRWKMMETGIRLANILTHSDVNHTT